MPEPLPTATIRTQVSLPLRFADGYATTARVFSFVGLADGREHLAFGLGDRAGSFSPDAQGGPVPLVRPHSECLTGVHLSAANAGYLATKAYRGGHTLDIPLAAQG